MLHRLLLSFVSVCLFTALASAAAPVYPNASYGGESVTLANAQVRLEIHKRVTGWGWIEIFDSAGRMIAVLDHLGEADPIVSGRSVPLRFESARYELEKGSFGQRIRFPVRLAWYEKIANSRFTNRDLVEPLMEGAVTITLAPDAPRIGLTYEYKPLKPVSLRYLRGPWLIAGAGAYGTAKTDGIFPGVEWLVGDEWSSGTDWFQHPQALRVAPHPFKVTAPVMALSHQGAGIGLAWNPRAGVLSGKRYPQPVFASPNFVDRANNHLMGLALPSAA